MEEKIPPRDVVDVIFDYMNKHGLSAAELSRLAGISKSTISHWTKVKSGTRRLSQKNLEAIAKAFNVTVSELLIDSGISSRESTENSMYEKTIAIPYLQDIFVGAGMEHTNFSDYSRKSYILYPKDLIDRHNANVSHCYFINVKGDSMEPTINDGDLILVDTSAVSELLDGHVYAFCDGVFLRIKRLRKLLSGKCLIQSDNKNYPDEEVSAEEWESSFNLLGRVIERLGPVN